MPFLDFFPTQGCYAPGETVKLLVEINAIAAGSALLRLEIFHLDEPPIAFSYSRELTAGHQILQFDWDPPLTTAGYAARVEIRNEGEDISSKASTAFDVLLSWADYPRYGFLTDFSDQRPDPDTTMLELGCYHINGLQFYDWQFRHDILLAPTDEYLDPLGRALSLTTVKSLINSAHQHGMAAMPYLAVYAASVEFWQSHTDWALFDENGQPIPFGEDFLGLMDPSPGSPWSRHILREAKRLLRKIPFDGLHIDQYGDPKQAWDFRHEPVDLPSAFVQFIKSAHKQNPSKAILFNAVGNWPIKALATAALDFLYIEVWPPQVEYQQLARIVLEAVKYSKGKAVVIALYLPTDRSANILLADAVILACGGTRIELGEGAHLLVDPYFPKHQPITDELQVELRRFYDFSVRSGEWLASYNLTTKERKTWAQGEMNPDWVSLEDSVWCVARRRPGGWCLAVINLNNIETPRWDIAHPSPVPYVGLPALVKLLHKPQMVYWSSPEQDGRPQTLDFEYDRGELHFLIPHLRYIGVIYIHD